MVSRSLFVVFDATFYSAQFLFAAECFCNELIVKDMSSSGVYLRVVSESSELLPNVSSAGDIIRIIGATIEA